MTQNTKTVQARVAFYSLDRGFGAAFVGDTKFHIHHSMIQEPYGLPHVAKGEPVILTYTGPDSDPEVISVRPLDGRRVGTVHVDHTEHDSLFVTITDNEDSTSYAARNRNILSYSKITTLEEGEQVVFIPSGPDATSIKKLEPRDPWNRHLRLRDESYYELAELADAEDWGVLDHEGSVVPNGLFLLRNYIKHTFNRLFDQNRIEFQLGIGRDQSRAAAVFNTGLVSKQGEDIYGLMRRTPNDSRTSYRLEAWVLSSDRRVVGQFPQHPQLAQYWESYEELYFNPELRINLSLDHITVDNQNRFPAGITDRQMAIRDSVSRAVRLAQRNHRAAMPQFYNGKVQLLLPLSLDSSSSEIHLALVLSRVGNEYIGDTVLEIGQAVNNARLLTRLESSWLNRQSLAPAVSVEPVSPVFTSQTAASATTPARQPRPANAPKPRPLAS